MDNSKEYLSYSFRLKEEEIKLINSFTKWLPDNIIDCHTHCNLPEHVNDINEENYHYMISTFLSFALEESEK